MRAGGQDISDMAGGVGLQRRASSLAAGPGLKSGEGKARAGETRARQASWVLGGASAGLWWVVVQREVVPRWRSARGMVERNRAAALGFWAAAVVVWCAREGHGVV